MYYGRQRSVLDARDRIKREGLRRTKDNLTAAAEPHTTSQRCLARNSTSGQTYFDDAETGGNSNDSIEHSATQG